MPDRRSFLVQSAGVVGALSLPAIGVTACAAPTERAATTGEAAPGAPEEIVRDALAARGAVDAETLARDETFWATLRTLYALDRDVLNLDHGWTNPVLTAALDRLASDARWLHELPAERLPGLWDRTTDTAVRAALAGALGVPAPEIALVRNATEALNTVLLGYPMRAGDEVVCSAHDYYAMLDALEQRRDREAIVLRMIRPTIPATSGDEVAAQYEAAIGPRTRLVLLTNPSNLTGQVLPVARIADAAHRVGAIVLVDGAQSLGLDETSVAALGADCFGASAHKWLGTPVGLGVLWMRPALTTSVWPLVPPAPGTTGIKRYEWIGTAPEYVNPAALPPLAVQATLGAARKAARLRHLWHHWRDRVAAAFPSARFSVRDDAAFLSLCTVALPGRDHAALAAALRQRHRILVQHMQETTRDPAVNALRVTPNVYTTPEELDRFVDALVTETA